MHKKKQKGIELFLFCNIFNILIYYLELGYALNMGVIFRNQEALKIKHLQLLGLLTS